MSYTIIDRRLNGKGKSSVNRRKFVQRVRGMLKDAVRESMRKGNLKDLASPGAKKVRIPVDDLAEPSFHHDDGGIRDLVLPGNDQFVVGDKIKRPPKGQPMPGSEGAQNGEGDDEFHFHLTREEFLDLFFENCGLPYLDRKNFTKLEEEQLERAGFSTSGSPSKLNIIRSIRGAKARKVGLRALKKKRLHELETRLEQLVVDLHDLPPPSNVKEIEDEIAQLHVEIAKLKTQINAIPFLDPMDLRYNQWHLVKKPSVQAVIFRVMDVSGSMGERMKEMAKTFFLMMGLFLERNYEHITVINIPYHSTAKVADDQEFFYGQETGGTVASSALQLVDELITAHYSPSLWNIYVAHASDGDNFGFDNMEFSRILMDRILPAVQYYAYIHVGDTSSWNRGEPDPNGLTGMMERYAEEKEKLAAARVMSPTDVFPVFQKLFKRKEK